MQVYIFVKLEPRLELIYYFQAKRSPVPNAQDRSLDRKDLFILINILFI
jgi:hypothetical protein